MKRAYIHSGEDSQLPDLKRVATSSPANLILTRLYDALWTENWEDARDLLLGWTGVPLGSLQSNSVFSPLHLLSPGVPSDIVDLLARCRFNFTMRDSMGCTPSERLLLGGIPPRLRSIHVSRLGVPFLYRLLEIQDLVIPQTVVPGDKLAQLLGDLEAKGGLPPNLDRFLFYRATQLPRKTDTLLHNLAWALGLGLLDPRQVRVHKVDNPIFGICEVLINPFLAALSNTTVDVLGLFCIEEVLASLPKEISMRIQKEWLAVPILKYILALGDARHLPLIERLLESDVQTTFVYPTFLQDACLYGNWDALEKMIPKVPLAPYYRDLADPDCPTLIHTIYRSPGGDRRKPTLLLLLERQGSVDDFDLRGLTCRALNRKQGLLIEAEMGPEPMGSLLQLSLQNLKSPLSSGYRKSVLNACVQRDLV